MPSVAALLYIFSIFSLVQVVVSVPVSVHYPPLPESGINRFRRTTVDNAVKEAQDILSKMQIVAQHPERGSHHLFLQTAFGADYDTQIGQIRSNIDKMIGEQCKIPVGEIFDPKFDLKEPYIRLSGPEKRLSFDASFYSAGAPDRAGDDAVKFRAGLIIRAAAKFAFDAKDHFDKKSFKPQDRGGYSALLSEKDNYKVIRSKGGAKALVHSSEAYRLLAHLITNGLFRGFLEGRGKDISAWTLHSTEQVPCKFSNALVAPKVGGKRRQSV